MKEEKPKNCKALITMPHPKIKIKIPKLLVNTILQRRNHKCNDTTNNNNINGDQNKSKRAKPKRLLPKKLRSIIHSVFGNNKSSKEMCCSCSYSGGGGGFNGEETETHLSKFCVSKSCSLKEILEIEGEMGMQESKVHKQPLKVSLSMGFNSFKEKINTTNNCSNSSNGGVSAMGKHESSSNLYRTPSRKLNGYRQIRRARSMRKKASKQVEEEDEEDEDEGEVLCKKRILMGERCRPLHISGTLNYDKNGILLPEVLPCEEM